MRNQIDIKNTSRYPLAELRELVKIARGNKNHGHVALNIKNSSFAFRGRAYDYMPGISSRHGSKNSRRLVVIAIGSPDNFPCTTKYSGLVTAPEYEIRSWQEAVVAVVAHELMHCMQYVTKSPRSEIEAEQAAVRAIKQYRELKRFVDMVAYEKTFPMVSP